MTLAVDVKNALRNILLALLVCAALPTLAASQDDAVTLFGQGQDLHEKGDLKGAIALYEKAIAAMPEFPEAVYQRAAALAALGSTDEALKGYLHAVDLRADWTLPLTAAGDLLASARRYGEARPLIEKALAVDPQNPQALSVLADIEIDSGTDDAKLRTLLDTITRLTAKANPTAALWFARASLEKALKQSDASAVSLQRTLAIDRTHRRALFLSARNALDTSDLERARAIAVQLAALKVNPEALAILRADILARSGDTSGALKELAGLTGNEASALRSAILASGKADPAGMEKQLESDPKNAVLLGRLCSAFRASDPQKALGYCQRASETEPNNVSHAIGFGAALVQAKRYEQAAALLARVTAAYPDNWAARANLATALFQMGRFVDARAHYLWLSEKQPDAPVPHFFLGIVYDRLDQLPEALAHYNAYLKLADPVANKLDIDKINLRIPQIERQLKRK